MNERFEQLYVSGRVAKQTYQSTNCRNSCNAYDLPRALQLD